MIIFFLNFAAKDIKIILYFSAILQKWSSQNIQTTVVILFQFYTYIYLYINFICLGPKSLVHWAGHNIS